MAGIDAVLTQVHGGWDFSIGDDGDIATQDFFDTAILVSLFTDARADASQILRPEDRRGWIGNEQTPGFEQGSLLWLYYRSRRTRTVRNGIADAARRSLQWMVEEGYAVAVRAETLLSEPNGLDLRVEIEKPNGDLSVFLVPLWENTGGTFAD